MHYLSHSVYSNLRTCNCEKPLSDRRKEQRTTWGSAIRQATATLPGASEQKRHERINVRCCADAYSWTLEPHLGAHASNSASSENIQTAHTQRINRVTRTLASKMATCRAVSIGISAECHIFRNVPVPMACKQPMHSIPPHMLRPGTPGDTAMDQFQGRR